MKGTRQELDILFQLRDEEVSPIPEDARKAKAARIVSMRGAGTEKGVLFHWEVKDGTTEIVWLNCLIAKEFAGAISFATQNHG